VWRVHNDHKTKGAIMKSKMIGLLAAGLLLVSGSAVAQEHFTDGPVWVLSSYQINEGQFDKYMTYLRKHSMQLYAAQKAAGLILDYKVFMSDRQSPNDGDITVAILFASAADAFDYDAGDDAKGDEIADKHWSGMDKAAAEAEQNSRYAMRRFISNSWVREVTMKAAP
jgi:hypothetical protein